MMSCFERLDERQVCFLDPWAFYFGRRIRRQAKRNIGLVLQLFGDGRACGFTLGLNPDNQATLTEGT
jgi:hypothetical protein